MTTAPVVTGLGVVAPNGLGVERYWAATLAGRAGIGPVSRFDASGYRARVAGEVEIDAAALLPGRLLPQTDRMTRLALVAAEEALTDAGLDPSTMDRYGCGVLTAASGGGFEFGQRELEALWGKDSTHVSAYQSFAWFYPVNSGQISIRHGLRGPGGAVVTEQAGGLDAIAMARRDIRCGTRAMVSGGVDGSLCPWSWLCQTRSGRLSPAVDADRAYLPFDADASGYVPGEGGALLVIEDPATAGECRYGEIAGYAATFDPRPGSGRPPALRRAVELALGDAGMDPAEVDVVFADASGVPDLDAQEAAVLVELFGPRAVPVTAPKTMTGRLLGGGAALDVATALLALRDGVIPPTVHIGRPRFADVLDLVRDEPRPARMDSALVLARGHGGFNSALLVRRGRGRDST
ncbi:ketosynthase chain-length factor [Actinokineospora sp. UTMC 2448]|uniref:ketosynthase chain-length factor n=1 Tax=Actinokineospora sp. UTMC 2448 TaxID=2268449 RepID=UPI002164E794|nr:ketosynthase chain-length factor [Actinokineospora sp. UTMC 2448]UVS78751.1 Actinorhodin polyketide putative beta-ketoacyl synthase 2 [Actinokineospora sp. UTMC 2448]